MVAEAIEQRLANPLPADEIEAMRVDYLDRKSPQNYARDLLELLVSVATSAGGCLMHVGIDIEQFVRDPYGSGIQRVLQYLALEWPQGDLAGRLRRADGRRARPADACAGRRGADASRSCLASRAPMCAMLVRGRIAELEPIRVKDGDLLSIYDAWLLPEVSYLPSVLRRFELFARCVPTVMIGYDALPMTEPANYRFRPGSSAWVSEYFRHLATADAVVCISDWSRDAILGPAQARSGPADHGRAPGRRPPRRAGARAVQERPVFARLGTLEARKRPVEIAEAFREAVASGGLDAELLFIGGASASDDAHKPGNPGTGRRRRRALGRGRLGRRGARPRARVECVPVHRGRGLRHPRARGDPAGHAGAVRRGPAGRRPHGRPRGASDRRDEPRRPGRGLPGLRRSRPPSPDLRGELDPDAVPTWRDFAAGVAEAVASA